MKLINTVRKGKNFIRKYYDKAFLALCLLMSAHASFADGIIPISSNDQTQGGSDFAQTLINIFQKGVIPVVMIGGAVWVLWTGISTMSNGIKEAQDRQKFDPLKNAIIKTVIIVVVGGALLYLLDKVRTYSFGS